MEVTFTHTMQLKDYRTKDLSLIPFLKKGWHYVPRQIKIYKSLTYPNTILHYIG